MVEIYLKRTHACTHAHAHHTRIPWCCVSPLHALCYRGMVESAFEFADICRKHDYHNFLFSMKASNPLVMVQVGVKLGVR